MENKTVMSIETVIDYIEANLDGKLDLEMVAEAVHYSKYHLHRMFTSTVGMTIHDYVQRRQLTEAAKLLVFSDRPIIEVAFICGYESQQAFSSAFKSMYKIPPAEYRDNREFYPLQLRFALHRNAANKVFAKDDICLAEKADIPAWMNLMRLVIDGYPVMNEADYLNAITKSIDEKRALVLKDGNILVGAMAFSDYSGCIDFLGINPQYRKQGIQKLFLDALMQCETKAIELGNICNLSQLNENLQENCIPLSVKNMDASSYEEFLTERRKLMAFTMKRYYWSL